MSLKHNDLKDTIANLISIDEYESKAGAPYEVIVVAFHVVDDLPAQDLADFLEKSYLDIIDAERSPNPNDKGHYLVFVEVKRNEEFFRTLDALVREVERLSGKVEWKISPYLDDNIYDYKEQYWKNYVTVDPLSYMTKSEFMSSKEIEPPVGESAEVFFSDSDALSVLCENNSIKLSNVNSSAVMEVIKWTDEESLSKDKDFRKTPFTLGESSHEVVKLRNILGNNWDVYCHGSNTVIFNKNTKRILYAKVV